MGKPISLFILKNKGEKSNIKDIMGFYGFKLKQYYRRMLI